MQKKKKYSQRGALFIEYALVLAFVIVAGMVFITSESFSGNVTTVFSKTSDTLEMAAEGGGNGGGSPQIDLSTNQKIGKYVYEYMLKELEKYNAGQESVYTKAFIDSKGDASLNNVSLILPDGTEVSVIVYNRNYNAFEDIKNRLNNDTTASFNYNRDTKGLGTVVYCSKDSNGKMQYSTWTTSDGGDWKNDDEWKDNQYTKKNGTTEYNK